MSDEEMYRYDLGYWGECWGSSTSTDDGFLHSVDYPAVKFLVLHLETHVTLEQADILAQRIHDRFGKSGLFDPDGGGSGTRVPGRKAA